MLFQMYMYAAEGVLSLALFNMSGAQVQLNADIATTVREVKVSYAEHTSVPVREQQLVFRGNTLQDADVLATHGISPLESHISVVRVRPPLLYVLGGLAAEESLAS